MKIRTLILIFAIVAVFVFSCKPPKVYPVVPQISFKELKMLDGHDTLGNPVKRVVLTMSVIDGDGNIGLPDGDTLPGFDTLGNKNLFIDLWNKEGDGDFEKVNLLAPNYYKTKFLIPQGQDKSLTADYEVTMDYYFFDDYDTIKYTFYIYDRDLNRSNIGESPAVPADTTGIFKASDD